MKAGRTWSAARSVLGASRVQVWKCFRHAATMIPKLYSEKRVLSHVLDGAVPPTRGLTDVLHETTNDARSGRRRSPAFNPVVAGEVPDHGTLADLLERLGRVSAARIRLQPFPGTATERDVVAVHDRENRLCELVDGTLVEKVMGFDESRFALLLGAYLVNYLERHDLGVVVGADGMVKLFPGLVRIPDAAFISWARYPKAQATAGGNPTRRTRPGCRGAQRWEHRQGNGTETR